MRNVLPALLNDFASRPKDTAIVSTLGVAEAVPFRSNFWGRRVQLLRLHHGVATVPRRYRPPDSLHGPHHGPGPVPPAGRYDRVSAESSVTSIRDAAAPPVLKAVGVHKSFGPLAVLRGVDLSVGAHEVVCLIGASGSGKSTLLRCCNLLERVGSGTIGPIQSRQAGQLLNWYSFVFSSGFWS